MSKSRAQRRAANRRRAVDRTERVKPSPLAEAKKHPWTMMVLLDRGPEAQGISAEQFEAGIDVAEAFEVLTRTLGYRAASPEAVLVHRGWDRFLSMSTREARMIAIYLAWATELQRRLRLRGHVVMEWVQDERSLTAADLPKLIRALDLWCKHRDEWRTKNLTKPSVLELTTSRVVELRPERSYLPTHHRLQASHAAAAIASPRAVAPLPR
jgi:hypothetical protein